MDHNQRLRKTTTRGHSHSLGPGGVVVVAAAGAEAGAPPGIRGGIVTVPSKALTFKRSMVEWRELLIDWRDVILLMKVAV